MTNASQLKIAGGLFLNLCCSICIVLLNKWLYSIVKFPNMTLTCIHFIATSVGLFCCKFLGVFAPKSLQVIDILPLSVTFCGFVVFTNLSLQNNSVGTYQLIKVLTTPAIMLIQSFWHNVEYKTGIKASLVSFKLLNSCRSSISFVIFGLRFLSLWEFFSTRIMIFNSTLLELCLH